MLTRSVSVCEGVLTEAVLTGIGARVQGVPYPGRLPRNQVLVCVILFFQYLTKMFFSINFVHFRLYL